MSAGQHESHCRDGDDGSRGHQYLFQPEHPCVLGGTKVVADGRLQGIHHTKEHGTDKGCAAGRIIPRPGEMVPGGGCGWVSCGTYGGFG